MPVIPYYPFVDDQYAYKSKSFEVDSSYIDISI